VSATRAKSPISSLDAARSPCPLAKVAAVTAFESEIDAVGCAQEAASHAPGSKPITVERPRSLPPSAAQTELEAFDAIVLDPPPAGATAQCDSSRTPR